VGVSHEELRELAVALRLLVELSEACADAGVLRILVERALQRLLHAGVVAGLLASLREAERDGDRVVALGVLEDLRERNTRSLPRAALLGETGDGLEGARMERILLEDVLVRLEGGARILHLGLEDLGQGEHARELERGVPPGTRALDELRPELGELRV